jgi:acyl carrier protein
MPRQDDEVESPPFRDWLIERLAYYLNYDPAHLDPTVSLSEYGLDSVYAVAVRGDVRDRFGIHLDERTVPRDSSVDLLVSIMAGHRPADAVAAP